jgi:hypothetical protein
MFDITPSSLTVKSFISVPSGKYAERDLKRLTSALELRFSELVPLR